MNRTSFIPFALSFLAAAVVPFLETARAAEAHFPVTPGELLKSLPATPPEWQLVASNAKHIPKHNPTSKAYREYRFTPPPSAPGQPALPPATVKISIMDTGGDSDIAAFFSSLESAAGAKRLTVDSIPAIRTEAPGETDHLEALAQQRYFVRIAIVGTSKIKAEDWLRKINLPELQRAATQTASYNPDKEFVLIAEIVDELNPKGNRSVKCVQGGEDGLSGAKPH